jgi:hypothetical protein
VSELRAGPPVRPEFGPTLPELLAPRLRGIGRARLAVLVVAGLLAAGALAMLIGGPGSTTDTVVVREPVAFNLVYDTARLERPQPPPGGAALMLRTPTSDPDPETFTVRPITLPAYSGDPAGVQPAAASGLIEQMRAADPAFILRSEGRTRINSQPGYQIQFQTRVGGRLAYGRRALLFPDEPGVRDGADVTVVSVRSDTIPNVDAVGSNGPMKQPYRSFRFGTERP